MEEVQKNAESGGNKKGQEIFYAKYKSKVDELLKVKNDEFNPLWKEHRAHLKKFEHFYPVMKMMMPFSTGTGKAKTDGKAETQKKEQKTKEPATATQPKESKNVKEPASASLKNKTEFHKQQTQPQPQTARESSSKPNSRNPSRTRNSLNTGMNNSRQNSMNKNIKLDESNMSTTRFAKADPSKPQPSQTPRGREASQSANKKFPRDRSSSAQRQSIPSTILKDVQSKPAYPSMVETPATPITNPLAVKPEPALCKEFEDEVDNLLKTYSKKLDELVQAQKTFHNEVSDIHTHIEKLGGIVKNNIETVKKNQDQVQNYISTLESLKMDDRMSDAFKVLKESKSMIDEINNSSLFADIPARVM